MNMEQFHNQFGSVEDCCRYLFHSKWSNGFECPRCGCRHAYSITTRKLPLYECKDCGKQTSLLAGTVMEGSRTCLRKWFLAFHLLSNGTTAYSLSRIINVTYKTAWLILNKIRQAIGYSLERVKLSGSVIAQTETYGRPPYYSWVYRHPKERSIFIGTTMTNTDQPSCIKISVIPDAYVKGFKVLPSAEALFADQHVALEAANAEYITKPNNKRRSLALKLIFRSSKMWIHQIYYGVGRRHLQSYFDEYCYRFNKRINKRINSNLEIADLRDLFLLGGQRSLSRRYCQAPVPASGA